MGGAVPPLLNTPSWRGAQLGGAQGQQLYSSGNFSDTRISVAISNFYETAQIKNLKR
jgi:hypothetical protein